MERESELPPETPAPTESPESSGSPELPGSTESRPAAGPEGTTATNDPAGIPAPPSPASPRGTGIPPWVFALLLVAGLAALFWPRGERLSFVQRPRPVDAAGERVALEDRFGRVTLLHFWASWCPPCLTEIPALKRLMNDLPAGSTGLTYVLVSVEDDPAKARELLGDLVGLNLSDPDWRVAHGYGTEKLPETYLIVDGNVVDKFVGATNWDDPALRERLRSVVSRDAR